MMFYLFLHRETSMDLRFEFPSPVHMPAFNHFSNREFLRKVCSFQLIAIQGWTVGSALKKLARLKIPVTVGHFQEWCSQEKWL